MEMAFAVGHFVRPLPGKNYAGEKAVIIGFAPYPDWPVLEFGNGMRGQYRRDEIEFFPAAAVPVWKAGDCATVKLTDELPLAPGYWSIEGNPPGGTRCLVHETALRPVPTLAAEDAAVVRAAVRMENYTTLADLRSEAVAGKIGCDAALEEFMMGARNARLDLLDAVRARAAVVAERRPVGLKIDRCAYHSTGTGGFIIGDEPETDIHSEGEPADEAEADAADAADERARLVEAFEMPSDEETAARDALVEAALFQARLADAPEFGPADGVHPYDAAVGATNKAASALRALLTPPPPVDPVERAVDALRLILPLAKGYAAANRVGSNQKYIREADDALAALAERRRG